ncbi:endo-beta-1,3-glucanase [Histoplasma capsulatum G186AR]|uniref:glucan endo-1,3-beta-D-glucosidase n=3 Tax=Ajellomyces capsulatus TaxID=5037 RepID=C0P0J2_AJECG|nr:endo-beta-1,3-glucanase [Histoplasma capsulatum G186AR]EEH02812.1 endo-beta-1,3-glucanase [Histoplasma capsulatum G186AR]KAG5305062.1 endo-beta-1,3-glucanase [Histoplasma capsulatum]QSS76021.1 endo-beta-1,3-glucanase [Histoplasma capsulatum G186AR]
MAYRFQNDAGDDVTHHEPIARSQISPQASSQPSFYGDHPHPSPSSNSPNSPLLVTRLHPAAHPDSAYSKLRTQRIGGSQDPHPPSSFASAVYHTVPDSIPHPHPQRKAVDSRDPGYTQSSRTASTATPGRGDWGAAASGAGIAGIAVGGTHSPNEHQRGLDTMAGGQDSMEQNLYYYGPPRRGGHGHTMGSDDPYAFSPRETGPMGPSRPLGAYDPYSSNVGLGSSMDDPGQITPGQRSLYSNNNGYHQSTQHGGAGAYYDDPYPRPHHNSWGPVNPEIINPNDIIDDGDDGFMPEPKRRSMLSLGKNSSNNSLPATGAAAVGGGMLGNISGRTDGGGGKPNFNAVTVEKSEWLNNQKHGKKKMKWIVTVIIALILIGGIAGGIVGGILGSRKSNSGSGGAGQSAEDDRQANGDLGIGSAEIKKLMAMEGLHKVFPGMDYTPWGTQYPLCLKYPPSQNNVTRDMAVLSQLTNTVRLYGTDCNQTEMVLHAIDRLELKDMKLWLGVWIDTNTTTNERQIKQLYKIVREAKDKSIFKGVIVGNEVLFRAKNSEPAATTIATLSKYMQEVKSQLKAMGADMPVATSDLGDDWTPELARVADAVMANVHPFFAGVPVKDAASWTWTFWQGHNVPLTKGTNTPQIISEVGWPSGGGNNCNPNPCPSKTAGSIAGITELNQFMADWVCQSLSNGTDYFWFEAFDEPWKSVFNEPELNKEWEDKWGLMGPDRALKSGLKIPDCGGKTAT